MSSTVISKRNSSPVTRRAPRRDDDIEDDSQRQYKRRSLSGRVRDLFRKGSPSPNRSSNKSTGRLPPTPPQRHRSSSPGSIPAATEAPHLRAPTINWPFGKKKTKSTETKPKGNRKSKKTPTRSVEISGPVYQEEYQTSIRGENFVPRTPEYTQRASGRSQSSSNFETRGFRDYSILDNTKPSQQVIISSFDVMTPPPYVSDRSRSPSLNRQRLPDANIEYPYYYDKSLPISDIEIIPIPKQNIAGDTPSLTTKQISVVPPTVIQSTNSNQLMNTSYSSLNNTEIRSATSSTMDVDVPKLHTPLIHLSSISSKKESKQPNYQDTYSSLSNVNSNQSYPRTYGSLPDADSMQNSSLKSTNYNQYPGLTSIIENHLRPPSFHFDKRSVITTTPKQALRFDTATTTFTDYNQRQQWANTNGSAQSPPSIYHDDGYIRPVTPQNLSIQPDINVMHINLGQSSVQNDSPIIYRSSAIIYTKDKHNYINNGELRTWSIQRNDSIDNNKRSQITFQIIPPKRITNEQEEDNLYRQQQYLNNRYYSSDNNFTRSPILNEREKIYDPMTRSYKDSEYIQEPLNTITPVENSEVELRHYTLKRTNSYNGLGIIISADIDTHLNHRIRDIEIGSPGSRVGLHKNDRIIKVNGINVENTPFDDVLLLIKQGLKNNNLQFSVLNESGYL